MTKKRIVVNRCDAMGDVIMTTPIIKHLFQTIDDAEITFLTNNAQVYRHNPYVKTIQTVEAFMQTYEESDYDLVIDLNLVYEKSPKIHSIDAYSEFVFGTKDIDKTMSLYPNNEDRSHVDSWAKDRGLDLSDAIIVHFGISSWKNKSWPTPHCVTLLAKIAQKRPVIIIGKDKDFSLGEDVNNIFDAVNEFNIQELQYLIENAHLFIGTEGGVAHIAGCTQTPIVTLFTIVDPLYRMAFRNGVCGHNTFPVTPELDCEFCLKDAPPPATGVSCTRADQKHLCVSAITPERVFKSIEQLWN